ncbi:N-acetylmuramoyl-L-alanine amidase [Desulfovibrio litoralis]|uniref:N-acetylmuramoyl-L-alanine amidase n=1 Tax=Desulfovibrio litoralis DSM 11393 TaxID=1121455 RepID=A0A1M7SNC7_9BACT|nr:N-acetylmuramoyl-L-alanine amidase [Desulfovibrio litoralis]SHN59928.1 N-acetylmuramoyl-L-alanine amidase [Desulfovibrio litoralis DSM 11393]
MINNKHFYIKPFLINFVVILLVQGLFCSIFFQAAFAAPNNSATKKYDALLVEYNKLKANKDKVRFRHNWEKIINDFDELNRSNDKALATKSLFQQAKIAESLSQYTRASQDVKKAISLFNEFIKRYPKSEFIDNALYSRGLLLLALNSETAAQKDFELIIAKYKKSEFVDNAKSELEKIKKDKPKVANPVIPTTNDKFEALHTELLNNSKNDQKNTVKPNIQENKTTVNNEPDPDKAQKLYAQAVKEWKETQTKNSKAVKNEVWKKLAEDFYQAYLTAPNGEVAPKALYQAAKAYESLALRTQKNADWEQVATSYLLLEKNFPENSLADDALYSAALIFKDKLKQVDTAKVHFSSILSLSKKGDMYGKAQKQLSSLTAVNAVNVAKENVSKKNTKLEEQKEKNTEPKVDPKVDSKGNSPVPTRLVEQLGLDIKTIMIDAGHGGKDPGAVGNGLTEKKIVLNMAKKLGEKLTKMGFKVVYSRDKDVFIPLQKRPMFANSKKVDLFVSLHINANPDSQVSGIETYYLDVASNSGAIKVAARENGVSIGKISDLQAILADFMLGSKLSESRDIAKLVLENMKTSVRGGNLKVSDNGVRSAPFYVLMGAKMPAVLVEAGYLTNSNDLELLKNDLYLQKITDGIANAIMIYKKNITNIAQR